MTLEVLIGGIVFAVAHFIFLLIVSFMLWMAVDAAKGDKFWWVVFVLGVPIVGATVYYFVEKKHDYLKLSQEEQAQ